MPAWPLARITTLVANSVPVIAASLLNTVQDTVVSLFGGSISLAALVVDGLGGVAATPTAGWIYGKVLKVTQAIGTTVGGEGQLYRDLVPFAVAVIDGGDAMVPTAPSILWGPNVASVARRSGSAGSYRMATRSCPSRFAGLADGTAIYPAVVVTTLGSALAAQVEATKETVGGVAVLKIDITLVSDSKCSVVVFP